MNSTQKRAIRIKPVARVAACFVLCFFGLSAQGQNVSEYEVKAIYLYNFSRFIQWPEGATSGDDSFSICVLGQDPFGPALNATLDNKAVQGKNVKIRRIADLQDSIGCRVLFISASEQKRLTQILSQLIGMSVLTVSDMPKFRERGGMVQFIWERDKVRFEVNLPSTRRAGLVLSADLLKVAANARRLGLPGD